MTQEEYHDLEKMKQAGWSLIHDETQALERRLSGADMVLRGWYQRSLQNSSERFKHPDFNSYAGMMVDQFISRNRCPFPPDIFNSLKTKYPPKAGIPVGSIWLTAREWKSRLPYHAVESRPIIRRFIQEQEARRRR